MHLKMKNLFVLISIASLFSVFAYGPQSVQAEEEIGLQVTPTIINESAKAKDLFDYEIKLKNNGSSQLNVYAMVGDVSETDGFKAYDGPGSADTTVSLASWISFKRAAIDLAPGQEVTVPLNVNISTYAVPGKRYAQITMAYGSNWTDASQRMQTMNFPKLLLTYDILDQTIEKAQLKKFVSLKSIFTAFPIEFNTSIANIGNQPVTPEGNILIYNRHGVEVAELPVNAEKKQVEAGKEIPFPVIWNNGGGIGQFKAKLQLEYGEKNRRDLSDSVLFWVFPLKWMVIIGGSLAFLLFLLTILIFKKTYKNPLAEMTANATPVKREGVIDLKKRK